MSDESSAAATPDGATEAERDADRTGSGILGEGRDRLDAIRADPNRRWIALAVAAMVGLIAAWIHWLGLFLAGALVGLVSKTLPRALAAGLAFGVLVLVVQVLGSPAMDLAEFVALTPVAYATVGFALGAPLWGSLIRGAI